MEKLYGYFIKHPEKMPDLFYKNTEIEPVKRCVCDYVAGMTDKYAIYKYSEIFIPTAWQVR